MPSLEIYSSLPTVETQKELQLVRAIVFNHEGEVLLIERGPNQKFDVYKYELPGGKIDLGEDVDAALRREVQEETGLIVELPDQEEMLDRRVMRGGKYDGVDAVTRIKVALADTSTVDLTALEHPEHTSIQWVTKDELQELVDRGDVSQTVLQAVNRILLSD